MPDIILNPEAESFQTRRKLAPLTILGIAVGILMPVVAALLYPTYTHIMTPPWVEWSRLIEFPFVVSEVVVIHWALRRNMDLTAMWSALARDLKFASIALLIGVFASSILISADPLQSTSISLITVMHLLFAFSVYHLVRSSSSRDDAPFIAALGVGLIILAVLTALKFGFPPPASQVPGGVVEWGSALPGFISVRHFGSWTGAVAAAFMAMLLYGDDRRRPGWAHFFYFLAAAMTVWSATRAAILALAVTAVILAVCNRKMPTFRTIGILSMLTGAAMTAAWLVLPQGQPDFQLYNQGELATASKMASGRLELWAATWDRWLDSPLLGWGSGSTFWEVYVDWTHTQPHNAVLQFLISWGLIGAAGALWLLGRGIAAVHATTMQRPQLQPLLAMLYTLLLMSLLEGMLHYPRFIMLIMILFAVILSQKAVRDQ